MPTDAPLADSTPVCTFAYEDELGQVQRGTFFTTQPSAAVLADPNRLKRAVIRLCEDMGWTFLMVQATVLRHSVVNREALGIPAVQPAPGRRHLVFSRDQRSAASEYGSLP